MNKKVKIHPKLHTVVKVEYAQILINNTLCNYFQVKISTGDPNTIRINVLNLLSKLYFRLKEKMMFYSFY